MIEKKRNINWMVIMGIMNDSNIPDGRDWNLENEFEEWHVKEKAHRSSV